MSNEIHTGNIPVNITSGKSQKTDKPSAPKPDAKAPGAEQSQSAVTVTMTGDVSRLQEIESMLKTLPTVNSALVAEISQLIAEGRLEINLDRIAANLLEAEAGITDPSN
jgi:flagellar biosynthesis anti-sigma factor FlgM